MEKLRPYIEGWIAGSVGLILTHPLDTIKTLIQDRKPIEYKFRPLYRGIIYPLIGAGLSRGSLFGSYAMSKEYFVDTSFKYEISGAIAGICNAVVANPSQRYKIAVQTKNIPKLSSIATGLHISILRDSIAFLIYFSVYERSKEYFFQNTSMIGYKSALLGGLAGASTWLVIFPIDTIKTQIQASGGTIREKIKIINSVNADQNIISFIRSYYKGFRYSIYRAVPLHAITFYVLEFVKSLHI